MHPLLQNSFGSLDKAYYLKSFFIGLIFPALFALVFAITQVMVPTLVLAFFLINSLLYPYARFAYQSIASRMIGNRLFMISLPNLLLMKAIMAFACWWLALLIAPIGLLQLYKEQRKNEQHKMN